jgi:lysyl-tRNA synthetase class 2
VSPRHNPEFTMMEFYAAYTDYRWLMDFTENLIRQAAIDARGSATVTYQGRELDLSKPFHRLTICGAIQKYAPEYTDAQLADADFLRAELKEVQDQHQRAAVPERRPGHAATGALRGNRRSATLGTDLHHRLPGRGIAAGARSDTQPGITERFELFITGREIANGFSELTTRKTRPNVSASRSSRRMPATRKRCTSTPTTSARSSTACLRQAAAASASTAW